MPRIAYVTRYEDIAAVAQTAADQMGLEITTSQATPSSCSEKVLSLYEAGHDVIILRGGLHDIVQIALPQLSSHLIRCYGSAGEHLSCLFSARQLTRSSHPTICSVARPPYFYQKELARILDIELLTIPVSSLECIDTSLRELMSQRQVDVLTSRAEYAEHLRWTGLPIYVHHSRLITESIVNSLNTAKGLLAALDAQRKDIEELSNILRYSFDAIIYINRSGAVQLCNLAAESLLNLKRETVQGKKLWELFPALGQGDIEEVLAGKEMIDHTVELFDHTFIVNGAAFSITGGLQGASFYFKTLRNADKSNLNNELISKGQTARFSFCDIIGDSKALFVAKTYAERFACHDTAVLLFGETGTGKELFAQSIHNASGRKKGPFVAVNCAALPATLLESELFGYVEGAFTGATKCGRRGSFETANGGTIFLDEISEMDYSGQTKLLRVLAEGCITRLGDNTVRPVNVRVITATNQNLELLVAQGRFRSDLYYRINVLSIRIPPLRERISDILQIFQHSLQYYSKQAHRHIELSEDAADAIRTYPWPGNVRQLKNFCERLVIVSNKRVISGEMIQEQLRLAYPQSFAESQPISKNTDGEERDRIETALSTHGGCRTKTAAALEISTATLWRKMKRHGLI